MIIVKADGSIFPNGDAWKCITCGVPEDQQVSRANPLDYPQAFHDGTRILAGTNIIDCGTYQLASVDCTPDKVHIYPIRWNIEADGSGVGGSIRELRKHPDDVHLGFNALTISAGSINQLAYFARLEFNPSPTTGLPLAPRYDLVNVTILVDRGGENPVSIEGDNIILNPGSIAVGELRGFNGRGNEVTYLGYCVESCNIDVFAADLTTGRVRRLTNDPEYVDPIDFSHDNKWYVILDSTNTKRQMFIAGMQGIPPIIDLIVTGVTASIRNNGKRRFFEPWLIDKYSQRGDYIGQTINAGGAGSPGSVNDPQWNAMADPKWSPDGTRITYWQQRTHSPACGGANPLPCPNSTAQGGRLHRLMVAHLTSRTPVPWVRVMPISDTVPWGTPYLPGIPVPTQTPLPPGNYTLAGRVSGSALITLINASGIKSIGTVAVTYHNYSDDGLRFINGTEEVTVTYPGPSPTLLHTDWHSNLTSTGISISSKLTGDGGFHLNIDVQTNEFDANGTLSTVVDGIVYRQPLNFT